MYTFKFVLSKYNCCNKATLTADVVSTEEKLPCKLYNQINTTMLT